MPVYRVVEQRMYEETYLVRADDEQSAKSSTDIVEEEGATDSWAYDTKSVELVEDYDIEEND